MSHFPYGYHFGSTAIDEWAMQFVVAIVAVVFCWHLWWGWHSMCCRPWQYTELQSAAA